MSDQPLLPNRKAPKGAAIDSRIIDHVSVPQPGQCPHCKSTIIVHCGDCQIQVTGCSCTFGEKMDEMMEQVRQMRLGLWTPEKGEAGI